MILSFINSGFDGSRGGATKKRISRRQRHLDIIERRKNCQPSEVLVFVEHRWAARGTADGKSENRQTRALSTRDQFCRAARNSVGGK
jgi:hypothetical protein